MKTFIVRILLLCLVLIITTPVFSQHTKFENEKHLLILDVQECWTENTLSENAAEEMIASINTLIKKTNPTHIFYVKSFGTVASLSLKGVKVDTLPNQDFDKRLTVIGDHIFIKSEGDAFTSSDLIKYLDQNHVKDIIVTGLLAEKCVSKTVLGGIARNYTIYILPEAIGAKSKKSKNKVVEKLIMAGAKLVI